MDYGVREAKIDTECNVPRMTVTDLLRETSNISDDLLGATRRINLHLFGPQNEKGENRADPKCFRDELERIKYTLLEMAEELNKMCCLIGV